MEIGDAVTYVDSKGIEHKALVTEVFSKNEGPSINVVYVSSDETQMDNYGRQITRQTSVVHESNQYAHGSYWKPMRSGRLVFGDDE